MRRKLLFLLSAFCLSFLLNGPAWAGFDVGVSVTDEGIRSFHLSVGDYYRVPERSVVVVARKGVPDDELPVVFFLAARTGIAPSAIVSLRLGGMSWMNICIKYGLTAAVFYVPVNAGPPYGKAYGHYKTPKNKWKTLKFSDGDIVNMVNLRFMTEHYGYPASEVMKMRDKGAGFVVIHGNAKKAKGGGGSGAAGKTAGSQGKAHKGKGRNK